VSTWYDDAACKGLGHLMFPDRGNAQMAYAATAICDTCPVTKQCLDSALKTDERFGVWGGLTERKRREIRNPRGPSPCGTRSAYDRGCRCFDCKKATSDYKRDRRIENGTLTVTIYKHETADK
jgi:WhiB family redox-sensing transcriptional regulator